MNERQNKNNIIYETDILNPSIQLLFYFTVSGIFSGPQSIAGATLGIWSQWRVNYKVQQMVAKGSSGRSSFSLAAGIANLNDLRRRNCFDNFALCAVHATFPSRFRGVFAHAKPTQNNTLERFFVWLPVVILDHCDLKQTTDSFPLEASQPLEFLYGRESGCGLPLAMNAESFNEHISYTHTHTHSNHCKRQSKSLPVKV